MGDIVPADHVGIAVVDHNAPTMVRVYARSAQWGRTRARPPTSGGRQRCVPCASRRRVACKGGGRLPVSDARHAQGGIDAGLASHDESSGMVVLGFSVRGSSPTRNEGGPGTSATALVSPLLQQRRTSSFITRPTMMR
jgi:hypothetical protein